jgi:hypothetical protein
LLLLIKTRQTTKSTTQSHYPTPRKQKQQNNNNSMSLTIDDIMAKFPNKQLPIIDGEPDYTSINTMVQLLYSNAAATLSTTLGGGQHGHIGVIMPAALYTTLSVVPYVAPPDPGAIPIHAANAMAAVRETEKLNHKTAQKLFNNHNNMNDALKT